MLKQKKHSVAAIIVTYYPDDRLSDLLFSIGKQVDDIWVIDNGSTGPAKNIIEGLLKRSNTSFNLILNKENLGLAAAQNQGIKEVINLGINWILLLDQDSIPGYDMIEKLMFVADSYSKKSTWVCLRLDMKMMMVNRQFHPIQLKVSFYCGATSWISMRLTICWRLEWRLAV